METQLQIAVADYLRYQYRHVLFFHVPNGGARWKREAGKLKRMGVLPGVPDLLIFEPRGGFHGLAIELKVKGNYPTHSQKIVLEQLNSKGWKAVSCYGFDKAREVIDAYLSARVDLAGAKA